MSNFLTPLCYTTLVAEIHNIKNEQIPAIADEISIARSHGDLRENAQYASAKERQRAVGTQPITFAFQQQNCGLGMESTLLVALLKKEEVIFIINQDNINVFMQMIKIFGILSTNHKTDVINIIKAIVS